MQAKFAMGVSLFKRDDESVPDYFLSFSPLAPMFGVKWRFAPVVRIDSGPWAAMFPGNAPKAVPSEAEEPAVPARRTVQKILAVNAETVEPAAAAAEMPKAETAHAATPEPEAADAGTPDAETDASASVTPEVADDAAPEPAQSPLRADLFEAQTTPPRQTERAEPEVGAAETPEPETPEPETSEPETSEGIAPALLYDAAPEGADDLKLIKGIGPKLEQELHDLGIFTLAQIAGLTSENLVWLDARLTTIRGRSARESWPTQAAELIAD